MQSFPPIRCRGFFRVLPPLGIAFAAASFLLALGFHLLSVQVLPAILLGLISGIFLAAGAADLRSGKIPNLFMAGAAVLAVTLQLSVNGIADGLIRSAVVVALWSLVAPAWFSGAGSSVSSKRPAHCRPRSSHPAGGGDLKVVGITWLVLAAFPLAAALILLPVWALGVLVVTVVLRLCRKQHYPAGVVLALAAIGTWALGLSALR